MPAPYYYYTFPFAISADDLTAIPNTPPIDNSVNYETGWTDPYELNLLTDPTALPIPRGQMNQLFYDITNNLQQYQQYGAPIWVTGNTVQYPIYATVQYNNVVYQNQAAANTATPGVDATWRVVRTSAYVVDTSGAANTLTIPLVPAPAVYFAGMRVDVLVANNSTGPVVANVAGLGNKAVTYTTTEALIGGEMVAGGIAQLEYDGTRFQLLNPLVATLQSSIIAAASAIALTTVTPANVTSLSLPKGKFLVYGNVTFLSSGGSALNMYAWASLVSATLPDASLVSLLSEASPTLNSNGMTVPMLEVTLGAPATVYLSCQSQFATPGTITACGGLFALKVG